MKLLYCDIRKFPQELEPLIRLLPECRREKMNRYLRREDRLRCLGGGLLLSHWLGKGYEKRLSYNPYGKPLLNGKGTFNLSHSGDFVVLAAADQTVGADVQQQEPGDLPAMAKISFHPKERRLFLVSQQQRELFYSIWTLKESYMKAVGKGFSLPPTSFSISFSGGKAGIDGDDSYHLKEIPFFPGYSLAVCCKQPVEEVRPEEITAKDW